MARDRDYQKLPGRGRGVLSYHTLWLGPGHLLAVESSGYRETYTRVELNDIQAIVVRRTNTMFVRAAVVGSIFLLLVLASAATEYGARVGWGIMAGLVFPFLLLDLVLGPTCEAELRTPVQLLVLKSLRRWRKAQKALDRLSPLIEETQGLLLSEVLEAGYRDIASLPAAPSSASRSARRSPLRGSTSPTLHTVLAMLIVVEIPLSIAQGFDLFTWLDVVAAVLFLSEIGVAIAALVRQGEMGPSPALRVWMWLTAGYLLATGFVGMIYSTWAEMVAAVNGDLGAPIAIWPYLVVAVGFGGLLAAWIILELRRKRSLGET